MLYLVAVCLLPIAAYDGERTEQRWLYQRSDGELCSCAPLRRWCLKSRTITAACASQDAWQSRCATPVRWLLGRPFFRQLFDKRE